MASRNLGFERERNLDESDDDRQILNNLGGGNIADDIALFRNNNRNVSELLWEADGDGASIVNNKFIFPRDVLFIYTNGDEVTVEGNSLGNLNSSTTYYVVDLELNVGSQRNQLAFGLSTTEGGSRVSVGAINEDITFIRTDIVTKENLLKLATPLILDSGVDLNGDAFAYNIGNTFTEAFDTIEESVGLFNFLRREKYATNGSLSSSRKIVIEGFNKINDPDAFNSSEANLNQPNSPGIFVTDPFSSVLNIGKTRAYSTDSNPWAEGADALVTKSEQVNIGDLFFSNGIKFESLDDLASENGLAEDFTHKIPIIVDGVEYFVLLKQ